MKIRDMMSSPAQRVTPQQTLEQAARSMKESGIGFLPVTQASSGKLDGVLTDRDICMAALAHNKTLSQLSVADAMSRAARTCAADADVDFAHEMMRTHRVHRLPITEDDGRLVGVLSIDDLARAASGRRLGSARADVAETVGAAGHSHLRR